MPQPASQGVMPVCDGTMTVLVDGSLSCSVDWEYVDVSVVQAFSVDDIDIPTAGESYITGVAVIVLMLLVTKPLKSILSMFR